MILYPPLPLARRLLVTLFCLLPGSLHADEYDTLKVGLQPDGRVVVPTNQILRPVGQQITFPGRPVDLAFLDEGKTLVAKNMRDLVFIEVATGKIKQTLALPAKGKPGFSAVGLLVLGERIYATDTQNQVRIAERKPDGSFTWVEGIVLNKPQPAPGEKADAANKYPYPTGLAPVAEHFLLVAASLNNSVQLIDRRSGKVVDEIAVGVAPFMIVCPDGERAFVSNWGGDPPGKNDPQGTTAKTPIRVDPRTWVANNGSVSVLQKKAGKWSHKRSIPVGLHPSGMVLSPKGRFLYVANANSDSVSVLDTAAEKVVETISCRPQGRLPFGSGSNALALSPEGATLYVANGTNNCLAVVKLSRQASEAKEATGEKSQVVGLIPTAWYPGAIKVSTDGKRLLVANIKGYGSLAPPKEREEKKDPTGKVLTPTKKNSHDHLGVISIIEVPESAQLEKYTAEVNRNNRLAYSLAGLEKPRAAIQPVPVPQRHGEPSIFKHIVYIIKENRTYDQVLGDMKEGNGDPRLILFGEEVTPNHHALAREFTLFDNFYCSGVLSADGHTWVNEAYVSDYLERSFGGFTRSYPDDGSDPLAYAPSGFLWDNALSRKKSIRNYGEYIKNKYPDKATWSDFYKEYLAGTSTLSDRIRCESNVAALKPFTHPQYPWFPLLMPDVYRARIFINELKEFEKKGSFPNLTYITLPCDHTNGTNVGSPTPKAMVADNDLALGQIIEALTHSKFWPEMCIFVVEDDPQNGFDHVDAHRTVALVISPYTKRKYVDHTNYNQTGMVKTIELCLGLPPMNQLDLSATPMRNCFQAKVNLAPYVCKKARIKLNEMNPLLKSLTGKARYWAEKSRELDLEEGDAADEDTLNRILWHSVRGYDTPYPEKYAGKKGED